MNKESAIQILERKNATNSKESLAITANPALTFQLDEQIKQINSRIDELKNRERDDDGPSAAPQVVPKGLRSFDEHDAGFFLQLLPGPYRADGLPESIHFWKRRIEQTDPKQTFRVGVMYGPSGCGKSSILRAGLLPHLANTVIQVCINATPDGTEAALMRAVLDHGKFFTSAADLAGVLRQQDKLPAGQKLLIVIDQFEQWLHGRKETDFSSLVEPLSQCNGGQLQALLLIRADFWIPLRRFMQKLNIPLEEDANTAVVDLFDPSHARQVLTLFGRAYDRLPKTGDLTRQQEAFLTQAIEQLSDPSDGGRISCVRLSLFADLIQDRPWTPDVLAKLGGAAGVGVAFLQDRISAKTAPPANRIHLLAARNVLESLLPPEGSAIKGAMQSRRELLEKSGYEGRPHDFDELLRILENQLRIITPTTPAQIEPVEPPAEATSDEEKYYQLTHDYLVPSIRKWLVGEKNPAERLLDERARSWTAQPENRQLPSTLEYLKIWLFADHKGWTKPQQTMMRRSGRVHALHWGSALATVLLLGFSVFSFVRFQRLGAVISGMASSRGVQVQEAIQELQSIGLPRGVVRYELSKRMPNAGKDDQLALACALAKFGDCRINFLVEQIENGEPTESTNIITALGQAAEQAKDPIESAAKACDESKNWEYKARLATVALHLGNPRIAADMAEIKDRFDPVQRTEFIHECELWHGDLVALSQIAQTIDDPHLRSALCLGVGSALAQQSSPPTAAESWRRILGKWYQQDPDAGTHSASGWALRQSKRSPPYIAETKLPAKHMDWWEDVSGLTLLRVPARRFERPNLDKPDTPEHTIAISEFWISDREITVGEFMDFIVDTDYAEEHVAESIADRREEEVFPGAYTPDNFFSEHPVQNVNWYDAVMFCNWLSRQLERSTCYHIAKKDSTTYEVELVPGADGFRLPTEAEWEYACRAGTKTWYSFGNNEHRLGDYDWYEKNSDPRRPQPLRLKKPNPWGLFDMHGNVCEWCQDWFVKNYKEQSPPKDPSVPSEGAGRVIRGGCWHSEAEFCRSALRASGEPKNRYIDVGFRVACSPSGQPSE